MPTIQLVPLVAETPDQLISVELDGNPYVIQVTWNERFGYFSLSLYTADDQPILINVKMVRDYPLLRGFQDTRLPLGDLYFAAENGVIVRPGFADLSVSFGLYYISPDAVVSEPIAFNTAITDVIGTVWDGAGTVWDGGSTGWDQ